MAQKLILITGGYGHLGQALAQAFLGNGDRVILTGRNEKKLAQTGRTLGCPAYPMDVKDFKNVAAVAKVIQKKYGFLDVMINNAAVFKSAPVSEMDSADFLEIIITNIYGPFICVQKFLPLLRESAQPLIVNIASTSGHRADPGTCAYNASKFGLLGFTESIAKELRKENIRVTSISPSSIHFGSTALSGKGIPLNGRDIAQTAVYIANSPGRTLFRDIELWATNP